MPSWIPGSYLLREFARHVVSIGAVAAGRPVAVEKIAKSTWRCKADAGPLVVTLTVHAFDASVRGAWLDRRRAFINGTHLFLLPAGRESEPAEVELLRPEFPGSGTWRVATTLAPVDVDGRGFGRYGAADYDELIDHPIELSAFSEVAFEAAGIPHRFVLSGRADTDLERIAADLRQLCETQIDFFGRPAPFDRYLFLGLAVGAGYGGLEHRSSSSLIFNRDDLPRPGEPGMPRDYQRFLGLVSHEYFHCWQIKRTKPAAFMPYRLDRRNHTRLLWVFEGITSYYQELMLLRSGLIGVDAFLRRVGELATSVYRTPGRFVQSVAEASFDAWDVLYKPEPNSPNAAVSYYGKGALIALALDLTLRIETAGRVSLDDVVRELWRRHGAAGVGVAEDGFETLAIELGGSGLAGFFDSAVRGTVDLPLAEALAAFGVRMGTRPAAGPGDRGGTPPGREPAPPQLGAQFRGRDGGLELTAVLDGSPAQAAGLCPGDILIAVDGLSVGEQTVARRFGRFEAGEAVRLAFFRGDELLEETLTVAPAPADVVWFELDAGAAPDALERRAAWLGP